MTKLSIYRICSELLMLTPYLYQHVFKSFAYSNEVSFLPERMFKNQCCPKPQCCQYTFIQAYVRFIYILSAKKIHHPFKQYIENMPYRLKNKLFRYQFVILMTINHQISHSFSAKSNNVLTFHSNEYILRTTLACL